MLKNSEQRCRHAMPPCQASVLPGVGMMNARPLFRVGCACPQAGHVIQMDDIAWKLNTRPRKSLGWKCPAELFLPEGAFDFNAYWANKLNLVALRV
nr:hypothetical protein [Mariprofundus erugo]